MFKELLKNKKFLKIIDEYLKKLGILDIILIGSIIRGKENPGDIDLLVVYAPKTKDTTGISYKIKKELEKINKNFHLIPIEFDKIFSHEFLAKESLLSEGFSLRQKKFISDALGYTNFILFNYSLKNLNKSQRMQFYYSLNGRAKRQGILEKNKCYKFSDRIILSPIESSETIKSFLERWNIKYVEFPIIIQKRIIKYVLKKV